jgi:prepilin-type N-terminal cleavage/methylation domain-containing protein
MITKSSGFSLVELLVVIAIVGILSAVGITAYDGYIKTSKRSAAASTMATVSLAQSEYFSNMGTYYYTGGITGPDCSATDGSSDLIEENLFNGSDIITDDSDFFICIALSPPDGAENESGEPVDDNDMGYTIIATDGGAKPVNLYLNWDGTKGTY